MITGEEMLSADAVRVLPLRERVGLAIETTSAKEAIQAVIDAEQAGVRQLWTVQGPTSIDALTVLTVAATQTSTIRMGTSVLPTYPRHPLAAIAQVGTFNELAPGRLRLGIGPSHRPIIEGIYGIEMTAPLAHTREYLSVLRAALWEGKVSYHGRFYHITASLNGPVRVPILISTLGNGAFRAAGEPSDRTRSLNFPLSYIFKRNSPSLCQVGKPSSL